MRLQIHLLQLEEYAPLNAKITRTSYKNKVDTVDNCYKQKHKNKSTDVLPPANICSICCMSCCWAGLAPAVGVGVEPWPEGGGFSGVTVTPVGSGAPGIPTGIPAGIPPGPRLERYKKFNWRFCHTV